MKMADKLVPERISDEEITREAIEKLGPIVKPGKETQAIEIIQETLSQTLHQGPLPPASELQHYDNVQQGFAERIVVMAEKEQDFRHDIQRSALNKDVQLKSRGQHYALAGLFALEGLAAYIAYMGNTAAAAGVAVGTIIGVVGIFVSGKNADHKIAELESKETP